MRLPCGALNSGPSSVRTTPGTGGYHASHDEFGPGAGGLGYRLSSPPVSKGLGAIERFGIETAETFRLQSCVSPVWDTVLSITALADSGLPRTHPDVRRAIQWVVSKQVLREGDWKVKNRRGQPGGWAFEFNNDFYPDNDDTAAVLIALHKAGLPDEEKGEVLQRGFQWLSACNVTTVAGGPLTSITTRPS